MIQTRPLFDHILLLRPTREAEVLRQVLEAKERAEAVLRWR